MRRIGPRHVGFALFALAVGLVCLRLGFWQIDRLSQRRQFNTLARERLSQPPLANLDADVAFEELAYRRANLRGTFDSEHRVTLVNRARAGAPGVHLVMPLRLQGSGLAVLVDRGWLPIELADPLAHESLVADETVEIEGILLPTQVQPRWRFMADATPLPGQRRETWRVLSIMDLQAQIPYPVMGVYLAQSEPLPGGELPIPDVQLSLDEGSHLSYAIQWFAFASIAWIGAAVFLLSRARAQPPMQQESRR